MRTAPAIDYVTGTDYYKFFRNATNDPFDVLTVGGRKTTRAVEFHVNAGISHTIGHEGWLRTANASAYVALDAEL